MVAILGQGYVGLPLSIIAAESGWKVYGIDKSEKVVTSLKNGTSHIRDVSSTRLKGVLRTNSFLPTTDFSVASEASTLVICLPTPLHLNRKPDLTILEDALTQVGNYLNEDVLVINESTSYPGTLRDFIVPILKKVRLDSLEEMHFASAPERIDPLNKEWDLRRTPRLVSGLTDNAKTRVLDFYSSFCDQVFLVSSPEVAEMAKLLENTFRQVNIALVNQLLPLCKELGIDLREVVEAAGSKPYGYMKFYPGAGVGGHCIPIDPLYLLWKARQVGHELPFIAQADEINGAMPKYVVERLIDLATPTKGSHIAILGVAYKAGISDVRESPAENVAKELLAKGLNPLWIDPLVESFHNFEAHSGQVLAGAIVVTAQEGLAVKDLAKSGVPILDCTGAFKGISGVEQL